MKSGILMLATMILLATAPARGQTRELDQNNDRPTPMPQAPESCPANPAPPYVFVGVTEQLLNGGQGYWTYLQACRDEFPGSRWCTSKEVIETTNIPPSPTVLDSDPELGDWGAWMQPVFIAVDTDITGLTQPGGMTCKAWSSESGGNYGLHLMLDSAVSTYGRIGKRLCIAVQHVACCASP